MKFWQKNRKKEYPDFWNEYVALFHQKKEPLEHTRFVAFDTETTGFDYEEDRVLSIGAIALKNNSVIVSDQLEVYIHQEVFNKDTVKIHGIRKNTDFEKVSEKDALESFVKYIGNAILVAHHAEFDRKMINKALQRQGLGTLKNKILDTGVMFKKTKHQIYLYNKQHIHYTLDELCNDLKISKSDRHTASGDAFITAMAFIKIVAKLRKSKKVSMDKLLRRMF